MTGRRLLLPLLVLFAIGCGSPMVRPEVTPAPSEVVAASPMATAETPHSAVPAVEEGGEEAVEDDVEVPPATDDVEVPPADVGSRDPFNSDVVDQNREGTYIIERALSPVGGEAE